MGKILHIITCILLSLMMVAVMIALLPMAVLFSFISNPINYGVDTIVNMAKSLKPIKEKP